MAATKSWNIVCCSDLIRPFPVLVTDPSKWTEGDLRREIFLKYSIPEDAVCMSGQIRMHDYYSIISKLR